MRAYPCIHLQMYFNVDMFFLAFAVKNEKKKKKCKCSCMLLRKQQKIFLLISFFCSFPKLHNGYKDNNMKIENEKMLCLNNCYPIKNSNKKFSNINKIIKTLPFQIE